MADPAALILRPLTPDDETAAVAGHEVMRGDDFVFLLGWQPRRPWADYLAELQRVRRGDGLAADRVPATFLVAELGGTIVGRTSIRHELTDALLAHGGHIGYGVLPSYRRRGLATEILRQSLVVARSHGVRDALLTCDEVNAASARTIEACGGVRDPAWPSDELDRRPVRRYWIAP